MIKVECYSGHKVNERPIAFSLSHSRFNVKEIIDRWYGENSVYFKVKADDENIYLLKYDECQDAWDLVFYQNPGKMQVLLPQDARTVAFPPTGFGRDGRKSSTALN